MLINKISNIFKNKNIFYLLTRYITYAIQFIVSIYIAFALGPYYFGIWGFILLIINYFGVIDFGFSNAVNLLIIKNKNDQKLVSRFFSAGLLLITILNFFVFIFFIINFFFPIEIFSKYHLDNEIWLIGLIAININYNNLLVHLYRINNNLIQISFYQSIVPILMLLVVVFFKGKFLLNSLVICYIIGNFLATIFFVLGNSLPSLKKPLVKDFKEIFKRGFFLFIYNVSFYLIILSLRTFISNYYTIEEFGLFAFAFTLGNSMLLLLQAISFLIYPKVVAILNDLKDCEVLESLNKLRRIYLTLTYLMLFLGLFLISFVIGFVPKYADSFKMIGLCSLTIVLYTNSFGYGTYLISKGFEKINALISISCLILNIILCYTFIVFLNFSFQYVIIATMFTYLLYTYLTVLFTKKMIKSNTNNFYKNVKDCFGFNVIIPYILALFLILFNLENLIVIPLLLFLLLSHKDLFFLYTKLKSVINNNRFLEI